MLWILFLKSSVDKYSLKGSIFMGLNDTPSGERIHIGFFGWLIPDSMRAEVCHGQAVHMAGSRGG